VHELQAETIIADIIFAQKIKYIFLLSVTVTITRKELFCWEI